MDAVLSLSKITSAEKPFVGGKGFALADMAQKGMPVPDALCITTAAYTDYVTTTGLLDRIQMELERKAFEDMRWEEIWDTSLRIRNLFLQTPLPAGLRETIASHIVEVFAERPVCVRSSAPGEDSARASFAGLHESYVNVRGTDAVLDRVRLVWASLWSNRALLYRRELELDLLKSSMAVVVQELITGERSGVAFARNPLDASQAVVEAVYGLNQGLVDGTIEPDQWILDRKSGTIISHHEPAREKMLEPAPEGVRLVQLPAGAEAIPPLDREEVSGVFDLCMQTEHAFGSPQDMEWAMRRDELYVLQSRPITASSEDKDGRSWYLTLQRSFENLKILRERVENELLPAMEEAAVALGKVDHTCMSDHELADEIERRMEIYERWKQAYWRDCIPFAHGMRLFGEVYNDAMRPEDPYEFMDLLRGSKMLSTTRNQKLEALASRIRRDSGLAECLRERGLDGCDAGFQGDAMDLLRELGMLSWKGTLMDRDAQPFIGFLLHMASRPVSIDTAKRVDRAALEERFLSRYEGDRRSYAEELLDLARASYSLRDDDNVHLGRIEHHLQAAMGEGRARLRLGHGIETDGLEAQQVVFALRTGEVGVGGFQPVETRLEPGGDFTMRARQLVGQPAGPGVATGRARVVESPSELFEFEPGEVLVCDAVDPNMTFVAPLASAVIERRGGMLIHGAIISREYGLPCVTGVPEATKVIHTGDTITVDGYLGIVVVQSS